jgi:hypothetical protein
MKKSIAIVLGLLFIAGIISVTADESEMFVKSMHIVKVYPHQKGYRIVYMKSGLDIGVTYFPMEWFYGAANKGEVIYGKDPAYPYMSIFWKNGEFHHVRLYLEESKNAQSWGDIDNPQAIEGNFDIETLEIEF